MRPLPWLTILSSLLLVAAYAGFGSPAPKIAAGLITIHKQQDIAQKLAILLAEECARRAPTDPSCIAQGRAAAVTALGLRAPELLDANERSLVEAFRHPESLRDLPACGDFEAAWKQEEKALDTYAEREQVLLGKRGSLRAIVISFWQHGSALHLLSSLVNLLLFGALVERLAGRGSWLAAFFGGGLLALLIYVPRFPHELAVQFGPAPGIAALTGAYLPAFLRAWRAREGWNTRCWILYPGAFAYAVLSLGLESFGAAGNPAALLTQLAFTFGLLVGVAGTLLAWRKFALVAD